MTVQIDGDGPGGSTWASTTFVASVNAEPAYVYAYKRQALQNCSVWDNTDTPEQSWFNIGSDESSVAVVVSLISGSVTSANVYPGDAGVLQEISGGQLLLTIPANVRIRVEINANRKDALHIYVSPTQAVPGSYVDYSTIDQALVSVDGSTFTVTGHGYVTGQKLLLKSSATLPTPTVGTLSEHEILTATVEAENTFTLTDADGVVLQFGEEDVSDMAITVAEWSSATPLLMPTGEHKIGRMFAVKDDARVFVDAGAVVTGSFDFENTTGSMVHGPGLITGLYATYEEVNNLPDSERRNWAVFRDSFDDPYGDNKICGVSVVATPYYLSWAAGSTWRNVHCISCWTGHTDGIWTAPVSSQNRTAEVVDCFLFTGDDAFKLSQNYSSRAIRGCFGITTANTIYHGAYFATPPEFNEDYRSTISNCHAMHLGRADGDASLPTYANCVLRSLTDGWANEAQFGHFNVVVDGLKVWGPLECRLFAIGNVPYFWQSESPRMQYGQIHTWRLANIVVEEEPGQLSAIVSKDSTNTPHDIEFTNITIGDTILYTTNVETYVTIAPEAYNLTWDVPEPDPVPEPVAAPAADSEEAIHAAAFDAPDIAAYTTATGASVTRRTPEQMETLDRMAREARQRSRGIRKTRASFGGRR
tara:strand:+ start:228 stop:2162 length:1935 start_codon:yes stop_codon:yes gene_type:complete